MAVLLALCVFFPFVGACSSQGGNDDGNENGGKEEGRVVYDVEQFAMGVDLSYVNQVLDHGGVYRDSTGAEVNPYELFAERGANVVRVRLWHDPEWVQEEVYEDSEVPLYSGLADMTETIRKAKAQDVAVTLDLHYSDVWADPSPQEVPRPGATSSGWRC